MNSFCMAGRESKILAFERPADFYYRMARSKFNAGDVPGAIARARAAAEKAPENAGNGLLLAELLLAAQRVDEAALILFELADSCNAENVECSFLLGIASTLLSDVEVAQTFLDLYLDVAQSGVHVPLAQCVRACLDTFGSGFVPKSFRTVVAAALTFVASTQAALNRESCPEHVILQGYLKNTRQLAQRSVKHDRDSTRSPAFILPVIALQPGLPLNQEQSGDARYQSDEVFRIVAWQFVRLHETFARAARELQAEGNHERLYQLFEIFQNATVASGFLLTKAIAAYNIGYREGALEILSDACKIDTEETASSYYLRLVNRAQPGDECRRPLSYTGELPVEVTRDYSELMHTCALCAADELHELQVRQPSFYRALRWAVMSGPHDTLAESCTAAAKAADTRSEKILRRCLLHPDCKDEAKHIVAAALSEMRASTPYHAVVAGRLVEYDEGGVHRIVPAAKVRAAEVARVITAAGGLLRLPQLAATACETMQLLRGAPRVANMWLRPAEAAAACLLADAPEDLSEAAICGACGADPKTARSVALQVRKELAVRKKNSCP